MLSVSNAVAAKSSNPVAGVLLLGAKRTLLSVPCLTPPGRNLSVNLLDLASFPVAISKTGTAQIPIHRDSPFEKKFEYDLEYVRSHSVLGDIRLILISIWITLRAKWEGSEEKL